MLFLNIYINTTVTSRYIAAITDRIRTTMIATVLFAKLEIYENVGKILLMVSVRN